MKATRFIGIYKAAFKMMLLVLVYLLYHDDTVLQKIFLFTTYLAGKNIVEYVQGV
jgi:hypothetical protein